MERRAVVNRKTRETDIALELNLDGSGKYEIDTGIGFFDHMLSGFARHGFFDLKLKVTGDLEVDCHHTIEDTGIVLGKAIAEALGDKAGIKRYGHFLLPMDECLVLSAVDLAAGLSFLGCGVYGAAPRGHGHRDGEGIFLCGFLRRGHESPPEGLDTGQQSSYDGSNV